MLNNWLVNGSLMALGTFTFILVVYFFLVLTKPEENDKGPYAAFRRKMAAWWQRKKLALQQRRKAKRKVRRLYKVDDILFNPITWTLSLALFVFAVSCIIAATAYGSFEVLVLLKYLKFNPMNWVMTLGLAVIIFIYACLPDTEDNEGTKTFEVPGPNYGALLTWAGMVLPAYLTTGKYPWIGRRIGFDWLKVTSKTIANAEGFVNLGDITFQVWNSADATDARDKTTIELPAKNRAPVKGSLTFILERAKPRLWLDAQDAGLDVGERARQEYQEIIERLNDTDVAAVQGVMSDWMKGETFITSFITKNVGYHKAGSIMRDDVGGVMIVRVGEINPNESLEEAKVRFIADLTKRADPAMLKEITKEEKDASGAVTSIELSLSVLQASSPITDVIEERGYSLKRITYGDVSLSKKVSDAAEQASAEADERRSQIASAETNAEVRQRLLPSEAELRNPEMYQLTTILAAAQDDKNGNIKIVLVPGANSLTSGLVAAANQTGSK